MTEADHADLSRRLALTLGWPEHLLHTSDEPVYGRRVWAWCEADPGRAPKNRPPWWPWRPFDYRDETIIWRVAERYRCFPVRGAWSEKWCSVRDDVLFIDQQFDTAAEAVARAVIGAQQC